MSDEINNDQPINPLSEQPGWAAPGQGETGHPQTPPTSETPAYSSVPYSPPPSGVDPMQNYSQHYPSQPAQPKKSKLWLWITLAIVIPLLACGIGFGALAFWAVGETKPAVDATNDFYKAAKAGEDLDPYTCSRFLSAGGFNDTFEEAETEIGEIDSYRFSSVNITNGDASVEGTVKRDGESYRTEVGLEKDDGEYKVCSVYER